MSNSGLIDIHVLEETASRVSSLTDSITKQISVIDELGNSARKSLGPAQRSNRNLGQFQENSASVLTVYEQVDRVARELKELEKPIALGPAKLGWREYMAVVSKARDVNSEMASKPIFAHLPKLVQESQQLYLAGALKLQKFLKRISKLVFEPLDGDKYLNPADRTPPFIPENVQALGTLIAYLDDVREVPMDTTDEAVLGSIELFLDKTLSPLHPRVNQLPGGGLAAFTDLTGYLSTELLNAFYILCDGNPPRMQRFQGPLNRLVQTHVDRAKSQARPEKHASPASAAPRDGVSASPGPQPLSSDGAPVAPHHRTSRHMGPDALQKAADANASASRQNTGSPAPPALAINTKLGASEPGPMSASPATPISAGMVTPGGAPPISSSPLVPPPGAAGGGGAAANNWSAFERIEASRSAPIPKNDLARLKREGLALLVQVFVDIEAQCRKSPITSEGAVSGATVQFSSTLQKINNAGHGVEVVLSEVATRAYLGKPLPPWAAKAEPSPAARANPVSLYYSDAILCLYSILHQIISDTYKDTVKTGVFMLSNLTTLERFITGSPSESLATAHSHKTPLMEHMGDVALQKLQQLMEQSLKEYLNDWSKLAPHLMESTITGSGPAGGKLTGKDRDMVKEKFRTFNSEFDALVERQKSYSKLDPHLRARMSQEIKKLIGPLYLKFYMKHKDGDFTKNLSKYVKYTPAQFEETVTF